MRHLTKVILSVNFINPTSDAALLCRCIYVCVGRLFLIYDGRRPSLSGRSDGVRVLFPYPDPSIAAADLRGL